MPIPTTDQEFSKVVDKTADALSSQVVERIRQWIIQGHLREGDALPSERELARIFDVSRMPIRGALSILKSLGVVQQVRGKGLVVKKIQVADLVDYIRYLFVNSRDGLHDLFEVRKVLEGQAAYLAAKRCTPEDIDAIAESLFEMERCIRLNEGVDASSARFHVAVTQASHNSILITINKFLSELLRYSFAESLKDISRHEISLARHQEIFQRIKERDAEGASFMMQKHLVESDEALNRVDS